MEYDAAEGDAVLVVACIETDGELEQSVAISGIVTTVDGDRFLLNPEAIRARYADEQSQPAESIHMDLEAGFVVDPGASNPQFQVRCYAKREFPPTMAGCGRIVHCETGALLRTDFEDVLTRAEADYE